eukprot:SAG11_NODE_24379_length_374_cov_0.789091_1_plen_51_part_01
MPTSLPLRLSAGPFNSWDRQPYVYRIEEDNMQSKLAVSPQTMTTATNLIYN